MRYKDLNNKNCHNGNYHPQKLGKNSTSQRRLFKVSLGVVSLVIIFFGLKLLISPMASAIAGFLRESTTTLSFYLGQSKLKEDQGITNVLFLGVDEREKGLASLTDTMVIASFRHDDKKVVMLSIPRDLWVKIPAFDGVAEHYTKINAAYSLGNEYKYSGGGIDLLMRVISDHLGIPIHYFAKVNFEGFEKAIDAVNGVDIYVEQAFVDYQYPRMGYEDASWSERWEVVSFEQGWQHMDGVTALKYARSRHSMGPEGSDFARARRQQKVLIALKDKIVSNETLFNFSRLKELYLALSSGVDTNIGLPEVSVFYEYAKRIEDFSNIETFVLSDGENDGGLLYVPDPNDFGGAYVLLPKNGWDAVREFVQKIVYQ